MRDRASNFFVRQLKSDYKGFSEFEVQIRDTLSREIVPNYLVRSTTFRSSNYQYPYSRLCYEFK